MTAPENAETVGLQRMKPGAFATCRHPLNDTLIHVACRISLANAKHGLAS